MNWQNVTLEHYQLLFPIIQDKSLADWEKEIQIASILYNLTEHQIDSLSLAEYKKLKASIQFLYQPIPGKPVKYIRGKKRKYRLIYDVRQMPFARYAEAKTFSTKDTIANMHKLSASMVQPMRRVCGIWFKEKYDAAKHEEYAEDLLSAPFPAIYHSAVFFCTLFALWMKTSEAFMVQQILEMNRDPNLTKAKTMYQVLCSSMDGFIMQNSLPTLKPSLLKRLGISPPSNA
jgi:hypothetical protein